MKKLHFSTTINASKEKVWEIMLGKDTYNLWTKVFAPGSNYEGDWSQGSRMVFKDPAENMGMLSEIAENREYEFVSIKHIGMIVAGIEDTTSEEAAKWASAFENYTLTETDGKTEVQIDLNVPEEYAPMFEEMWPKALELLKELAEK